MTENAWLILFTCTMCVTLGFVLGVKTTYGITGREPGFWADLKDWAARLQVSVPTLMRMEKGDPTVSMGVYATALWILDRHQALAQAADPKEDLAALEAEIRQAVQRHRPRGARGG